jgi:hypothetical protein
VKSREVFAENLNKTGWSGAVSQDLIRTGEQSGFQTPTATTESEEKLTAFLELETVIALASGRSSIVG